MFSNKKELIENMVRGLENGTLVPEKHSESSLGVPDSRYRTVVVPPSGDLRSFFISEEFTATLYSNSDPKHPAAYVVIKPNDASFVAASGVPRMSLQPTHPCDVFVSVSGVSKGVHLFGEVSANVSSKLSSGAITFVRDLL